MLRWLARAALVRIGLRILPARLLPFLTAIEAVRLGLRFHRSLRERQRAQRALRAQPPPPRT
jgi:hypothetical protein